MNLPVLSPSEFIALINQTLEFAYPSVEIEGEVTNFKISKNRWVYFDIADEFSKVRCFGTVYMLPAPVEDGMRVRLVAVPKLHSQFGFSLNLESLQFAGEGTLKKAADLLMKKLESEGLFAPERKRPVPYPPDRVALVTSAESAAYHDFIKVLDARYGGIEITLIEVAVQGESAVGQVTKAIEVFNKQSDLADVLVIIRGGGNADDLQAFSSEQVTRAVAASRIPTVVAIGHEVDVSLAELAADLRASTPSNAAELLVPDRKALIASLGETYSRMQRSLESKLNDYSDSIVVSHDNLITAAEEALSATNEVLRRQSRTLEALSPKSTLKRGYAIVRSSGRVVKSASEVKEGQVLNIELSDSEVKAKVQ